MNTMDDYFTTLQVKLTETYEDFVYDTILPYCEEVTQLKLNKEELKQILLRGIQKQQPYNDCISREEAIRVAEQGQIQGYEWQFKKLCTLSSVTPKYTNEEIDRAQAVEQAYVDKMVELAVEETKRPKEESVIDKIRADIENHCGLAKENHCRYCSYCNNLMGIREILEIIDKYKSSEQNLAYADQDTLMSAT